MGIVLESVFSATPRDPHRLSTGDLFVGLRNNPQLSAALAAGDEVRLIRCRMVMVMAGNRWIPRHGSQ